MRFLAASVLIGLVGFWASEVFFWTVPHRDYAVLDQAQTCLAYGLCAVVALFVVVRAGVQGVRGAFLGGCILGFLVEGAVVATIYDAFPFQLIWTPIAWHGLISGGILGLGRMAGRWGAARMAAIWAGFGVFGAVVALYWPMEVAIPAPGVVLAYLAGNGVLVVLAQVGLDRVGRIETAPLWAVALPAGVLALAWGVPAVASLDPLRLVLPVILAGLVWLAFRIGDRKPLDLGAPGGWRHGLFLITPLTVCALAPPAWAAWPAGVHIWPLAVVTSLAGVAAVGLLVRQALSMPRQDQSPRRKARGPRWRLR